MATAGRQKDQQGTGSDKGGGNPVVIKKYANRRLYNTATSSYVTLDHLCQMVKDGVDFVVYDAKSGDDITRSVLTQIIFEEESKGQNMLPISFLRQLIGFYGDSLQSLVPGYLEVSMESFAKNQEQMRQKLTETFGGIFPFPQMEEMGRQNMAMFEQAMSLFNPFATVAGGTAPTAPSTEDDNGELQRLQDQLRQMQDQINKLAKKDG
ncbi:MAG: polyhydroxyalkanoate synthesis repressor PhaR [Alphaproteobacteria bacterium]